ncbi:hypothetical protein L1I79_27285 [Strepomyces sp. STD 3.1]|nr:hypothetical protein [Streptomyces sp. STD 3.1]
MAQASWPSPAHNDRAVNDAEYEKIAALFSGDGIYGDPTHTAVVTAGIGLNVAVAADVYGSLRGHAWTSGSSGDTLAIAPNVSGQTRVDRVVLRLTRSTWTVRAVVKEGTPGAGPPVLSTGDGATYEVLLANVTVLNGASSVSVVRGEQYVGSRIRPCRSTALTYPSPRLGDVLWEVDTGRLRLYDGAALRTIYSYTPDVLVNAAASGWRNEVDAILEERSGTVTLRLGSFQRTGGTLSGGTESRLPALIPAAYRPPVRDQYVIAYVTGVAIARITVHSKNHERSGQVWLVQKPSISRDDYVLTSGVSWVVE